MSKADNKELEEAIKILEDKECFWNNSEIKVLEAIETVLKELKRLQEDCVEKDKIREKIEECIKNIEKDEMHDEWGYERCKIQVLKELLEGK